MKHSPSAEKIARWLKPSEFSSFHFVKRRIAMILTHPHPPKYYPYQPAIQTIEHGSEFYWKHADAFVKGNGMAKLSIGDGPPENAGKLSWQRCLNPKNWFMIMGLLLAYPFRLVYKWMYRPCLRAGLNGLKKRGLIKNVYR